MSGVETVLRCTEHVCTLLASDQRGLVGKTTKTIQGFHILSMTFTERCYYEPLLGRRPLGLIFSCPLQSLLSESRVFQQQDASTQSSKPFQRSEIAVCSRGGVWCVWHNVPCPSCAFPFRDLLCCPSRRRTLPPPPPSLFFSCCASIQTRGGFSKRNQPRCRTQLLSILSDISRSVFAHISYFS